MPFLHRVKCKTGILDVLFTGEQTFEMFFFDEPSDLIFMKKFCSQQSEINSMLAENEPSDVIPKEADMVVQYKKTHFAFLPADAVFVLPPLKLSDAMKMVNTMRRDLHYCQRQADNEDVA